MCKNERTQWTAFPTCVRCKWYKERSYFYGKHNLPLDLVIVEKKKTHVSSRNAKEKASTKVRNNYIQQINKLTPAHRKEKQSSPFKELK